MSTIIIPSARLPGKATARRLAAEAGAPSLAQGISNVMPARTLELVLPYPRITGNHSVRHARGRHYIEPKYQAYIDEVAYVVRGRKAPSGEIHVDWVLQPPDRRARDFDDVSKVVCDALTRAGFWADDSNKVIPRGSWRWLEPLGVPLIALSIKTATPPLEFV